MGRDKKNITFDEYDSYDIHELLELVLEVVDGKQEGDFAEKREICTEVLKDASEKTIEAYRQYVKQSDYENTYKLSRKLNVWAKKIRKAAMEHIESYLYMMGFFNGVFNACKGFTGWQNEEAIFTVQMSKIIERKGMKEILRYLYQHDDVQNKKLCDVFSIAPNLLHKRLEPLITVNCVTRYSVGKYAFYSLSVFGKNYVKNILGYKKDEAMDMQYMHKAQYKEIRKKESNINYKKRELSDFSLIRERNMENDYRDEWEVLYARDH